MIWLALETATPAAAVAVVIDGHVAAEEVASTDRHHTEALLPCAQRLLGGLGISPSELGGVVVDVGPGLFTGLRVGVATARSLAAASGLGIVGLSSLAILATDPSVAGAEEVCCVVDARRGEVFAQSFAAGPEGRVAIDEARVLAPEALAAELAGSGRAVVGDGALRHAELFAGLEVSTVAHPSPAVAGIMADSGRHGAVEPAALLPIYLRDPDAVANFRVATQIER